MGYMNYEERLEVAKRLYELSNDEQKTALECIFPELCESEGEKIRKRIIHALHGDVLDMEETNKALAWLEKQGEQNPFDYENANIQQKDFAPQEDAPRYSVGDVLCDKSCTTLDKDAQPNYEIVDIRNGLYICDKGYVPISQQDEYELVAKKIEQKPTNEEMKEALKTEYKKGRADAFAEMQKGWSEEDEIRLQVCIDCLQAKSLMGKVDTVMTNWLKSLKQRIKGE